MQSVQEDIELVVQIILRSLAFDIQRSSLADRGSAIAHNTLPSPMPQMLATKTVFRSPILSWYMLALMRRSKSVPRSKVRRGARHKTPAS